MLPYHRETRVIITRTQEVTRGYLERLAVKYGIATKDEVRGGLVTIRHTAGTRRLDSFEVDLIRVQAVIAPLDDTQANPGLERLHALRSRFPGGLLDVGVCELLEDSGFFEASFQDFNHLKRMNGDYAPGEPNALGPLFTFDGTIFEITKDDVTSYFVVGFRYDKLKDQFFRVVTNLESLTPLNQARTLALVC